MSAAPDLDIVIFGATGFTGRLVAEYFKAEYGDRSELRCGLAGRNQEALAALREQIGLAANTPIVLADASDYGQIEGLARSARTVISAVGPYQLHGDNLVAACAAVGTDYVDFCGEPIWMRRMIEAHEARAAASGARIVFSCGFDSVPFDLGVFMLQEEAHARCGQPVAHVKGRVRAISGGPSGGTLASLNATIAAARNDPAMIKSLRDPFLLTSGFKGPKQPKASRARFDPELDAWLAPFAMAPINARNIHRSNALLDHAYGADFIYDEMLVVGPGESGERAARRLEGPIWELSDQASAGQASAREPHDGGGFDLLFYGVAADGAPIATTVSGDCDPGYVASSRMACETAICLIAATLPGGVWTPAAALGNKLIARLSEHGGLRFTSIRSPAHSMMQRKTRGASGGQAIPDNGQEGNV